ncbi:MAG: hypothetical protein LBL79_06670 [Prevotella sp.]|nr:hypothetical protein [Prevotella sp.]
MLYVPALLRDPWQAQRLNGLNSPFRLRQASRFTPFSPDGFPARKAHGARLTRIIGA